ncbi:3-phosphoshikimate 1-carboxyvinyltransferase [Compostibacter hankyongensis]|uniref:3-phosphoshikimate 1-carboxyvinyltransferase n=1 Tax=Compostibacter hankyongensis TaxID=1007089 RepID=A0ABP8FVA8_9BACT
MNVTITPSSIKGKIAASPSKSAMQRAVAAAMLAGGKSIIHNPGLSSDSLAALDVAEKLGSAMRKFPDRVEITSEGIVPLTETIHCGEAGLGIRMFTPVAALSNKALTIVGEGSLASRPMDFFEEILPQLNVSCQTRGGKLPIRIQGPLQAKDITIDGSLSSQFLTGLLMAYGVAAGDGKTTITVRDLKSRPYIDLTLQLMAHFGVQVENRNYEQFIFSGKQHYHPAEYTVEGDWSGAAFLLVAGAVAGDVEVSGLNPASAQSDKAMLDALHAAGARVKEGDHTITVSRDRLDAFEMDATDCPDLFPPLVSLAANCNGTTKLKGVSRLAHKESNRGKTLQDEFAKLGIRITLKGDEMEVHGGTQMSSATLFSHNDHRIAMACAVAALNADGAVVIEEAEAVNKSYPEFWQHLGAIGGMVDHP